MHAACRLPSQAANRLAAAALTGCQGGRCVRAHDFAPAFDTAGCDVDRCIVVGVPNEATPATFEHRLAAAIPLVDPPTRAAHLRCIGRVDFDERNPSASGLIRQERPELSERPRVHRGPLALAKPYPFADSRQFFDGDTAFGAFSLCHDALGDLVINVGGETGFFPTSFLEQSPRRPRLLGLQPFPQTRLSFAVGIQAGTGRLLAGAGGGSGRHRHFRPIDSPALARSSATSTHICRRSCV
jgi:hypothetical protein